MKASPLFLNTFGKNIIPLDDDERVEALHNYYILDTPAEGVFDNLAHIIASDFDVPIALISLVDKDRIFFKANVGMPGVRNVDRGVSLCSLAILSDEPTIFNNTLEEPCLLANPLVHGNFGLRFYAGAPIITADGYKIGTVCIVDKKEKVFTKKEEMRLTRYSKVVMHEIAVRLEVKQKGEALIQETSLRQKKVTEAVINGQEIERSVIGLELHDNINQKLTTIKLYNEMVLDGLGDTKTLLAKSSQYLQDCIDEIRAISKHLSAPTLGKILLEDSIRDLVQSINYQKSLAVNYSAADLKGIVITEEMHLTIYRIVQEQLNNIIQHADATVIAVELLHKKDKIQLLITDNGKGFDTLNKRTGIGITNMKTRTENLKGSCTLMSAPGKGCQLSVTFPIFHLQTNTTP